MENSVKVYMGNLSNLKKSTFRIEQSGPYSSRLAQNFFSNSSYYSGSGSTVILPILTERFSNTSTIGFGDRAYFFYRYSINRRATVSGISIAYTANTAVSRTITSITESSGTATATSTTHGFVTGDRIRISGATPSIYNGTKLVLSAPTADTFTFAVTAGTGSASGSITAREFVGAAIYDADPLTLLPKNKLADVASIPSTSNVITNLDSNITLDAGTYWSAICGSRRTNNGSLATLVTTTTYATVINTNLFGMRTSDFSQYRGGVGVYGYDNNIVSNGNSGMPAAITTIGTSGPSSGGVVVQTDASAGGTLLSCIAMIGLVVA
jgi:hypothetical protein